MPTMYRRHWITAVCDHVSPRAGDAIVIAAVVLAGALLWGLV